MKMRYLSAIRRQGNSKASGAAYDMCTVTVAVPVKQGIFGKDPAKSMTVSGHGLDTAEISLQSSCLGLFADVPAFTVLDFETDQEFVFGKLETIIIGFKYPTKPDK